MSGLEDNENVDHHFFLKEPLDYCGSGYADVHRFHNLNLLCDESETLLCRKNCGLMKPFMTVIEDDDLDNKPLVKISNKDYMSLKKNNDYLHGEFINA